MNDHETQAEAISSQLGVLDQQLALGVYLEALLRAPEPEPEIATRPQVTPAVLAAPTTQGVVTELQAPPLPQPVVPGGLPERASSVTEIGIAARPEWAEPEFQCLLFQVAGLTLALPLAQLRGVLPWDAAAVTEMPNRRSWFLGLRTHLAQRVKLIDLAQLVLPDERRVGLGPADGRVGKVILIGDGQWGLACDNVAEVVRLASADVKWRARPGNRPWMAGTVIDRMCVLIDTRAFAEMLEKGGA